MVAKEEAQFFRTHFARGRALSVIAANSIKYRNKFQLGYYFTSYR